MLEIIFKEFRELLYSPKFIIIAAACTLLIFISLGNGLAAYNSEMARLAVDKQVALEELQSEDSYRDAEYMRLYRQPSKLAIFDTGITGVFGRSSSAGREGSFTMGTSRNSDNPILAAFGELDLTFIVTTVMSLFALLFSYNSISGERENGTLRMLAANSISRTNIVISKLIGGFIPLALVFIIPFIVGLAFLMILSDTQFTANEWIRIVFMASTHLLFLLAFYCIGLAMSAISRRSFMSFLLCISIWVLSVGVVPRAASNTAIALKPVMDRSTLMKNLWSDYSETRNNYYEYLKQYFDDHNVKKEDQASARVDANEFASEQRRKERNDFQRPFWNEFFRQRNEQIKVVHAFSYTSPVSCSQIIQHQLADTGPYLYFHFKDAVDRFNQVLAEYLEPKLKEERENSKQKQIERSKNPPTKFNESGRLIVIRRNIEAEDEQQKIDLTGLPEFKYVPPPFQEIASDVFTGMGVLAGYAILFFAIAYVAFLRYDVR